MKVDPTRDIPNKASKPEVWIQWHRALKSNFGRKQANALFVKAWTLRGSSSANQPALRDYLSKQGITISTTAWDKLVDTGGDVTDFFGDIFNFGKYSSMAIAVVIIGGAAMLIFNIAKSPNQTIGAVGSVLGKGKR